MQVHFFQWVEAYYALKSQLKMIKRESEKSKMDEEIKPFSRDSVVSSSASLKVRTTDNLMIEDKRESMTSNRRGSKLIRSFDDNRDEDDDLALRESL